MYKIRRYTAALVVLGMLLLGSLPSYAQQSPTGSGLSISPTLFELSINPGQSSTISINLKNITLNKINAKALINDFESDNSTGNPKLISDPNQISPHTIRRFILGLQDVPLDVGQQKTINLPVQVSKDATPGAYYGVIRYKAIPVGPNAPKPGEVALSASVGTIVLITVPGNVRDQVQLGGLHVYRGGYDGTIFFRKPSQIGVEVRNLGNGFVKPFGVVEVKDMRGKVVYSYQINSITPKANVLPSSNRIFKDALKNITSPGRYTVSASVSYGSSSQILTVKKSFWYIPLWLAIVLLAIFVVLLLLLFTAFRRYRRGGRRSHRHRG